VEVGVEVNPAGTAVEARGEAEVQEMLRLSDEVGPTEESKQLQLFISYSFQVTEEARVYITLDDQGDNREGKLEGRWGNKRGDKWQ
jgi:hypothetical protein